jgi:hypothetical protein
LNRSSSALDPYTTDRTGFAAAPAPAEMPTPALPTDSQGAGDLTVDPDRFQFKAVGVTVTERLRGVETSDPIRPLARRIEDEIASVSAIHCFRNRFRCRNRFAAQRLAVAVERDDLDHGVGHAGIPRSGRLGHLV